MAAQKENGLGSGFKKRTHPIILLFCLTADRREEKDLLEKTSIHFLFYMEKLYQQSRTLVLLLPSPDNFADNYVNMKKMHGFMLPNDKKLTVFTSLLAICYGTYFAP